MLQAFFTGLSGMLSFSKNLDNVSNNIANLNTPGFKGSDTFYSSISSGENGIGTQISGQQNRFSAGDIRQTGNATDLAISGDGFFVLLQDGEVRYTRAGQFEFDSDGFLVDANSKAKVATLDKGGQLVELNINDHRVIQPKATTEVSFKGNLSSDVTEYLISGIDVYNSLGEKVSVSVSFTKNTSSGSGADSWLVEVRDKDSALLHSDEIRFSSDGTPVDGFNKFKFNITDSKGTETELSFGFGDPGKFDKSTSVSGGQVSTLSSTVIDGYPLSDLTSVTFTQDGLVQYTYENGEVVDGLHLALASVANEKSLTHDEGSLFKSVSGSTVNLGAPGSGGFGGIISQNIELSNVDLSREFADMIVIQRGYQASSRILNVANELIDQLYENTRG